MRPHSQDQPLEPTHDSGSGADATQLDSRRLAGYPHGFEEDDQLRSNFIRHLTLQQLRADRAVEHRDEGHPRAAIPRVLVRFWHDLNDVPPDVQACLESWNPLRSQGIAFRMFCDVSAASFIAARFGPREVAAFARCRHPAMRSDYLRMCFLFAEGGLYVDTDDVLIGDGWC